ncbi:MAG: hypothetical protein AAGF44_09740 [Pseudomonadota bacterium]
MSPFYIVLVLILLSTPVPMWRILGRAGVPKWLAVLSVVPVLNVALLWFIAFRDWPGDQRSEG